MFGKNNQRGITWKLRKWEQSFVCVTCGPYLKHIPIKLHEDSPNHYRTMVQARICGKNNQKGHNFDTKKVGTPKGHNFDTKKVGTIIFMHDMLAYPKTYSYKIA